MTPYATQTLMAQLSRRVLNPEKVAKVGLHRQGPSQGLALSWLKPNALFT